ERKRLEAALGARDRMVTVGTLAAGVSHEINNPLLSVSTNVELLAEELRAIAGSAPARFRTLFDMITDARQGAERIRKIVHGLRTFARGEREQRAEVDLRSVIEIAISLTQNELKHHVQLVREFRAVPFVLADESRLAHVFINLLMNAAQAMAELPVDR